MSILALSDSDQQRYGVPAEIEYEPGMQGRKAVAELKAQTGYTLDRIRAGTQGIIRVQPDGSEVIERDDVAAVAYAWMLLWDAGHKIPWDDFDLHGSVNFAAGETEDEEEGKAPDPDMSNSTTTTSD